jgi:hypothetical protein
MQYVCTPQEKQTQTKMIVSITVLLEDLINYISTFCSDSSLIIIKEHGPIARDEK